MSTATKREQIMAAVAATLVNTTGVSTRIYRSRVEAFSRNESPALVIEPGTDTAASEPVSTCKIDWTFQLIIAVYTRGAIPDQVADPVIKSVHSKLMTDRSIGGLAMDLWPVSVEPQLASADLPALWTVLTYQVRYRSSITDLSISAP
jgi:hypothetical protein